MANRHLVKDLCELGLWDENLRRDLLWRTVGRSRAWLFPTPLEGFVQDGPLSQKSLLDLSGPRAFVDQRRSP